MESERKNLSGTSGVDSHDVDMALSPDRDWVVAAWLEGDTGSDILVRALEVSSGQWDEAFMAFSGTSSEYAYDVAVQVTDQGIVHLAYVLFDYTSGDLSTSVVYKTCDLDTQQCPGQTQLAKPLGQKITWVDLALDATGDPHVVWARSEATGGSGDIKYRAYSGGSWGPTDEVSGSGDNVAPAIACAGEMAHIVWLEQTGWGIWYSDGDDEAPTQVDASAPNTVLGSPDVAASGNRLFVTWDQCVTSSCEQYYVVYNRSNNAGGAWGTIREVGTDAEMGDFKETYNSLADPEGRSPYLLDLQPSIALDEERWPAVAWHADSGSAGTDYRIYYTWSSGGSSDEVNWVAIPPMVSQHTFVEPGAGSVTLGVGEREGGEYLHSLYVEPPSVDDDWDVYYEGFQHTARAHITADAMAALGQAVTLDGSGSYSPSGGSLSYNWQLTDKPTGSSASIDQPGVVSTELVNVDMMGAYTVTLEVDDEATTDTDTVCINVYENVYSIHLPLVMRQ